MTLVPYADYQPAPEGWIGQIPAHWEVEKIKFSLSEKGKVIASGLPAGAISYGRVVVKDGDKILPETLASYQEVRAGEFLINPINLNYDLVSLRTALSDIDVVVSPAYLVLRADQKRLDPRYGNYLLHIFDIRHMKTLGAGVRQTIGFQDVGNCMWALPSLKEQRTIADYLDSETNRIDRLIERKNEFIQLLSEKRDAVVTHAVTKGLNPDVEMQATEIASIGSVPAHWQLNPVGRALQVTKRIVGDRHDQFSLLSLTTRGVIKRDISQNFGKFPESFDSYQEVDPGNFVFCLFDMDETPRTVGLSENAGMITGAYAVFECIEPAYSQYLLNLFLHLDNCKGLKPFYTGLRKTIRPPRFTSIRIPFPPEDEARQIAEHIERQCSRIERLVERTKRSIELLREHRTALITAAVTGKIDVRNAA